MKRVWVCRLEHQDSVWTWNNSVKEEDPEEETKKGSPLWGGKKTRVGLPGSQKKEECQGKRYQFHPILQMSQIRWGWRSLRVTREVISDFDKVITFMEWWGKSLLEKVFDSLRGEAMEATSISNLSCKIYCKGQLEKFALTGWGNNTDLIFFFTRTNNFFLNAVDENDSLIREIMMWERQDRNLGVMVLKRQGQSLVHRLGGRPCQ